MALAARRPARFDGGGISAAHRGDPMKRVLLIMLGLAIAMSLFGLLIAFTRPIKWPDNVASSGWRRSLGEEVGEVVVEEAGA
jgi:hypothetical protein